MAYLKVSTVQFDISAKSKTLNFEKVNNLLLGVDADLIVLPEMFNTAYNVEDMSLAETIQGDTINWMQKMSKESKYAICGSLLVKVDTQVYNRFVMVSSGEVVGHYDKTHLFKMSREEKNIAAGNVKADMVVKGFKIRPIICYDLRFPYTAFNDTEYDVLINVASWPSARISHWDALLKARSIENQAYVIGCNRVGEQQQGGASYYYPGHSSAYAPDGKQLAHSIKEEVISIELDKNLIEKLPFLKD